MMNPTVVFRSAVDSSTSKDDGVGTQRRGDIWGGWEPGRTGRADGRDPIHKCHMDWHDIIRRIWRGFGMG